MAISKGGLAKFFRKAAAFSGKGAGLGLYLANGLLGDIQSAEFIRTTGSFMTSRIDLKKAFRNAQIGACWATGLVAAQIAGWTTRDPFSLQQVAHTALYYADRARLKKHLESRP